MKEKENAIKVVRYGGRLDPIYEEIGEIELSNVEIGRNSNTKEICIDLADLMSFINRER